MKNFLFVALLLLSNVATAENIPKAFQGKWVGTWQSHIKSNEVKAYCQLNDFDHVLTLSINKNTMQMNYWEASETVSNFKFSQVKPNYFLGTAKFVQSGFLTDDDGNLIDKDIVLNRKVEFMLKKGELIELYRDDQNDTGKSIWYKRYWKKCN